MKGAIVGVSYIGKANAVFLAPQNEVVALDIGADPVGMINRWSENLEGEKTKVHLLGLSIGTYDAITNTVIERL